MNVSEPPVVCPPDWPLAVSRALRALGAGSRATGAAGRGCTATASFYTDGPSKLQRYLPFRLASWLDRFLGALVAIASAAITIFKIIPALISLPFRLRMRRGYIDLQALERAATTGADKKSLLDELARVDRSTASINPPMHNLDIQWIELRQFVHDMRDRLEAM